MNYYIWTVNKCDYQILLTTGGIIRRKFRIGREIPRIGDRIKFNNFPEIFEIYETMVWEGAGYVEVEVLIRPEREYLSHPMGALALSSPIGQNVAEKERNFLDDAGAVWDLYSKERAPGDDRFAQYWADQFPDYVRRIEIGTLSRANHDIFYVKNPLSNKGKNEVLAMAAASRIKRDDRSWYIFPNATFIFRKPRKSPSAHGPHGISREQMLITWAAEAVYQRFISWAEPDLRDIQGRNVEVRIMTNDDFRYLEGCVGLLTPSKLWKRMIVSIKHHT